MLELAAYLLPLLRDETPIAVVTVTRVLRSAPRGVGASLAVTADARIIGSISGGCVESDAAMLGLEALRTGGVHTARFGFSRDIALPTGLACGGAVEVLAYPILATDAVTVDALEQAAAGVAVSVGVVASGPAAGRVVAGEQLYDSAGAVGSGSYENRMLRGAYDGADLLVLAQASRPRLLILGAGEHAAALCRVAAASGFSVTVCDAWSMLVTTDRFPQADELVVALPHEYLQTIGNIDERTAVCVLTHDERLDVPALLVALSMPIGFVGAMGARATVARRAALLRQTGVDERSLAGLHSPLGLDLGGSSPDETAVAVIAEIIASRNCASALALRDSVGPLHRASFGTCVAPVAETVGA